MSGFFTNFFSGISFGKQMDIISIVFFLKERRTIDLSIIENACDSAFRNKFLPKNETNFVVDGSKETERTDEIDKILIKSVIPENSGLFLITIGNGKYSQTPPGKIILDNTLIDNTGNIEHNQFICFDLIGEIGSKADAFRFIGKVGSFLSKELNPEIIYLPNLSRFYSVNEKTLEKLNSRYVIDELLKN